MLVWSILHLYNIKFFELPDLGSNFPYLTPSKTCLTTAGMWLSFELEFILYKRIPVRKGVVRGISSY